jgi:hypothetical protein
MTELHINSATNRINSFFIIWHSSDEMRFQVLSTSAIICRLSEYEAYVSEQPVRFTGILHADYS